MRKLCFVLFGIVSLFLFSCQPVETLRKTSPEELRATHQVEQPCEHRQTVKQESSIQENETYYAASQPTEVWELPVVDSLIGFARTFIGTPYKWGGTSPSGFDCSGFVYYVFHHYEIMIPRMPADIAKGREQLGLEDIRPGDLVYFRGRDKSSSRIGHIALVTEKTGTGFRMVHASSSKGIIENDFEDYTYWTARFLFATRFSREELENKP